jgi:hypothetical protein
MLMPCRWVVLRKRREPPRNVADPATSGIGVLRRIRLLVVKSLDRIQAGGADGGIEPEDQPDGDRDHEREDD